MTLEFCDVSHWNGDYHPVGPTLAKATEGTSFVDSRYATTKARTQAGGWPFAGYHFLSTEDPTAQAKHAYATIGATPAMLDVETGTSGHPTWAAVKAFITAYRALGGIMHLAYIPHWYWEGFWGSPDLTWLADNDVALISSSYVKTYSDTGVGWNEYKTYDKAGNVTARGNVKPAIWQFTDGDTSQGYSYGIGGVDTNAFKGTVDELRALFETGHIDMALTDADVTKIWTQDGIIDNRPWRADATTNPKIQPANAVELAMDEAHDAHTVAAQAKASADAALAAVKALQTGGVDVAALAAALAPLLAPVVHAELTKLYVNVNVGP